MCVIVVCEEGLKLTDAQFESCFKSNDHGVGLAWINRKDLCWSKGYMDVKSALAKYKTVSDFAHIAHFRLSSAGGVCPELTHPFLVTPDSPIIMQGKGKDRLLFHNGTISGWKDLVNIIAISNRNYPDGAMSDTRAMAMSVGICGEKMLDSGKYVIASPDEFLTYGDWTEDEGIYYSNTYWKNKPVTYYSGTWDADKYKYTYGKTTIESNKKNVNAELPLQLKGSGKVISDPCIMYKQSEECKDLDDEEIFASKVLNNYYRRSQS